MSGSLPLLSPGFNKSLQVEARTEQLTADAGPVILRDILDKKRHLYCQYGDDR
jgi:hypothetical protein